MTTILNQSEYNNGQVLDDVKLQTINEQLFGNILPNSLAEPHINSDGTEDIGTQTNRWRTGNFSTSIKIGDAPSGAVDGVALGTDGVNNGVTLANSSSTSSYRSFLDNDIGHLTRGGTTISSPGLWGQAMDTRGLISHGANNAAPAFIEAYNLNGRIRSFNTPKAYAVLDGKADTVQMSYGFSSIAFGTQAGQGNRNYATLTFDANSIPPNATDYIVLIGSDDRLNAGSDYKTTATIYEKNTTELIVNLSANTNSGNASFYCELASIAIYWEGI